MNTDIETDALAAYVDGELGADEVTRFEAHLANSAADRAEVVRLRRMNALLSDAYEAPLVEPLPPALQNLAGPTPRWSRSHRLLPAAAAALAASVALAVGIVLGGRMGDTASANLIAGPLPAESQLHEVLETEPTRVPAPLPGSGTATVVATFFDNAGRPCREVKVAGGASSAIKAIACRDDATWRVEVAVTRPEVSATDANAIVPASGRDDDVLDAALDALGAGLILDPKEEVALIEREWRP